MADVEPVYEYKKGEGWVARQPPRPFPHFELDMLCNTCGKRAGAHGARFKTCPRLGRDPETEWS